MARSFSVTNLILAVREATDHVNDTFVSDAEITRWLSASWAELYMLLIEAYPERFMASQAITATGADGYAVDATYLLTLNVGYQSSSTGPLRLLRKIEPDEYLVAKSLTGSEAYGYIVIGSSLGLIPKPSSGSYFHTYVPVPADLASGSTTIDGEAGWEQYLIEDVAGRLRTKEESDPRPHWAKRDQIKARIEKESGMRDLRTPSYVQSLPDETSDPFATDPASWRWRLGY